MATRPAATPRRRAGGSEDGADDPALPQKKRARHRLIGAITLCLLAAVVVPLLLDSEPTRPPPRDVAIVIPSRDTPLPARPPAAVATPSESKAVDAKIEPRSGATVRGTIEPAPTAPAGGREPKGAEPKSGDAKAAQGKGADAKSGDAKGGDAKSTDAKSADAKNADVKGADARAAAARTEPRRDGKADDIQHLADVQQAKARGETTGRYLLQVGAFGGEAGASAAVDRVQSVGLRAFTEKIRTDRGERVRVRVGPFPSRETAEQARGRLKAVGIEAAVIAP